MTKRDYKVGYGKPPRHTQFKAGQSGNPKGRPKGVKNLSTDLQEELEQTILVTEANKTLEVTKQRAMLKTMFAKALKGQTRPADILIKLILRLEQARLSADEADTMSDEDQAVLDSFRDRLVRQIKSESGKSNNE